MYRTALVLALSVLSTALPQPQAATSGDVTTTQAASCPAQPAGAGPVTSPDTDTAFLANNIYSDAANNAVTPSGYMRSFVNLKAATSGSGYLGFSSIGAYNPQTCANLCANTFGCNAFNIYFERDPSVDPTASCPTPNPSSTVNIKCAYFGSPITEAGATNTGQYRNQFHVVIAGSNGYSLSTTQIAQPPCVNGAGGLSLYYYGSGYVESNNANKLKTATLPNFQTYDICTAFGYCLKALGGPVPSFSLEIYRTSDSAPWVCQSYYSPNKDTSVFNVASSGAVAYGWST